jgi:hypothetical protein
MNLNPLDKKIFGGGRVVEETIHEDILNLIVLEVNLQVQSVISTLIDQLIDHIQ